MPNCLYNIPFHPTDGSWFYLAAITKYHKLCSLQQWKFILSQFWNLTIKIVALAEPCFFCSLQQRIVPYLF